MNITMIGGDLRIVRLAELYSKEGNKVYTYGLEEYFNKNKNNNVIICSNEKEAVDKSEIIVSGVPISKDGIHISAPYSKKEINLDDVKKLLNNKVLVAGNIPTEFYNESIKNIDLLKIEELTILNAIPTAEGTIKIIIEQMEQTIHESKILICGYGRIGKILCKRLSSFGANIYCAARRDSDLAWIREAGYFPVRYSEIKKYAAAIDVVINTVPVTILKEELKSFKNDVLIIDVASNPGGIDKEKAKDLKLKVITALGIPGKEMPISAASYIKEIIDKTRKESEIK